MSGWLSYIGGYVSSFYNGVYALVAGSGTPSSPATAAGSGSAGALHAPKKRVEYPATNVPDFLIANAISYTTPDDAAPVALVVAESNSQMRDKIAPHVFSQLHNVVRFARATPDQDRHVLSVFARSRQKAVIDTLCLREVRAEPLPALTMIVQHRPLQLTTIDFYKCDLVANDAAADIAAAIGQCANLTSVGFSDCNLGSSAAVAAIVPTLVTKLPNLKRLDLSKNHFRIDGAVALASQPFFIDPAQMSTLALAKLEHLDLGGNALGSRGLETLLRVHFPGKATPKLKLLDVRDNGLHDDGARVVGRFLAAVSMPHTHSSSAAAAKASDGLKPSPVPELEVLDVSDNSVSPEAVQALRERFQGIKLFS